MAQKPVRNVLVTGAGDSVGRLIAERFLALGDRVHIGDVRPDALAETLRGNPGLSGSVVNVGSADEVEALFADALNSMGAVDVLVNMVGIAGPHGPIEQTSIEDWRESVEVNLNGLFYCIRQAVPGMKAKGQGCIVTFSSSSTRTRLPLRSAYVASKFAVEGLTLNLARELGPFGIRCNAVLPGLINNERANRVLRRVADAAGKTLAQAQHDAVQYVSTRSVIEPEELAETVLFLASDAARNITGQLIGVDGNTEWEI